ncbi:succinate dehydrogenase cytochrome b560 subunit [Penicillium nucicola]|uniref:succinate dehydrogenase cytochrome b560 subunit n=1 Tax=Penicillium nucicola TaxID=1850975 RepID=UPI002545689C|nr:succinate dehydrogenase cytochrome b560 subunit [Penicillium nucicola]KAJ5766095.1 succinate dehydrogenase cytochrome b560 subunit [Penicillium nucicola]
MLHISSRFLKPIKIYPRVIRTLQTQKNIATQKVTAEGAHDRLAAQRRNRPIAPHLTVYKWTYVSSASAIQRVTGLMLSGTLYGFATLYLCAPVLDLNLDSTSMAAAFGSLPTTAKAALKFGLSMPFTYHGFNGVKHLVWDSGRLLSKTRSGGATWVVLACSISSSFGLGLY